MSTTEGCDKNQQARDIYALLHALLKITKALD
jgi:hypothetical protein